MEDKTALDLVRTGMYIGRLMVVVMVIFTLAFLLSPAE